MWAVNKWAVAIVIRRRLWGPLLIEDWADRYAKVRSDSLPADEYIENKAKKWRQTLEIIRRYTPARGSILETGCGTSAMSIWLNKQGFANYCLDNNQQMLNIAKALNDRAGASLTYSKGELANLPFADNSINTIFSQGVLEHFADHQLPAIINEGLRVARTYIFAVPTICDISTCLRGDENLKSYFGWKRLVKKSRGEIIDARGYFPFHPMMQRVNSLFKNRLYWFAPTLVCVIREKQHA